MYVQINLLLSFLSSVNLILCHYYDYLYTCTPVHLYTCTPVYLYTCTPVHLYTCIAVHLYTCTPVYLYTCTPVYLYTCTPVHLYTCIAHISGTEACIIPADLLLGMSRSCKENIAEQLQQNSCV